MDATLYPGLIPSFEHERLAALQPYQVLGTPGQGAFNDFVSIVAKLLDVPIALISLVREKDVVFVGNEGLPEATVVNREDSMCSVAILNGSLTVFEDVAAKPCDLINPYVAQKLQLGFYAGQALRAPNGMAMGTLCVIDYQPRQLSPAEGKLLTQLSLVAQDLLTLQARSAADTSMPPDLRTRLDTRLQESLTRLQTLSELRSLDLNPEAGDVERYTNSRLDEAIFLAKSMHRELQAVLRK